MPISRIGTDGIENGAVVPADLSTGGPSWTSSGDVGIGTSSPGARLNIDGAAADAVVLFTNNGTASAGGNGLRVGIDNSLNAYVNNTKAGPLVLSTSNAERARIDSSGNLLVGQTAADARFVANNSSASMPAAYVYSTNGSFNNDNLRLKTDRAAGGNAFLQLAVFSSSSLVAFIRDNGNLANANNVYGAISDAKRKENIVDATPKLEKINQVRVVSYNLIGEEQKQIGVIAQELEQIFPGMVEDTPDRDEEGNDLGTATKSVKYSVFVPMLIKAIQELNAKVEAQAAEIAALKGAA